MQEVQRIGRWVSLDAKFGRTADITDQLPTSLIGLVRIDVALTQPQCKVQLGVGAMQEAEMVETIRAGDLREKLFTLTQAAQILSIEPDLLRKKVDRGLVTKSYVQQHGRKLRAVDGVDIVFLLVSDAITPKIRNILYLQLKQWPESRYLQGSMSIQIKAVSGDHTIDVSLDRPVRDAIAGIDALERTVADIDSGGTVVGKGVKAHRIAALIEGGMSSDEVLRDYPNLTEADIKSSMAYAKANPKHGRPYPTQTVKSALRKGRGGLGRAFAAARRRRGA